MVNKEDFIQLNNSYDTSGNCASRIINLLLVPTLMYAIVVLGYFGVINFKVEIHSVILIGIIYIIYLNFIKHNAYFASCKFKKQYATLKAQLEEYINKNILQIDQTIKANASIDDFLYEFTINLRNTNFSSVASGIFPTLGILGTFISIAITMPDFSSQSQDMLEKEISLLLGGVGTAFYVSIYGIFLSIWWIFFEKLGMSRFDKDILIIKENTKSFFWNKIDIEKIHFQKSIDNYEKLNKVFSGMDTSKLASNVNSAILQKVDLFEKMIQLEEQSMKKAAEHFIKREKQQDEFIKAYAFIAKDMQNLSHNTALVVTTLGNLTATIKENENYSSDLSQELAKNISELNSTMNILNNDNIKTLYSTLTSSIEEVNKTTNKISKNLNNEIEQFDDNITSKLATSLEMIDEQTTSIVEKLASIK